ncbi:FAD/NAD(P)-binding protein [Streptomyces sp. NPDC051211]|uniref:FAD/NAD(P)-binding protein n=1 Tax=Streptomyces sp. NPDC051211 TaxID=3154643 RepID=UPI00344DD37F
MTSRQLDVCLIGAGPRGLSVLERICAHAAAGDTGPLTVHVVDDCPPGPGQVWRTDQSEHLLMNTVASQVTMFTDESVTLKGPLSPGPSLYEWARFLTLMGPIDDWGHSEAVLAQARALGPDSYPTRAFYGHYLEWVFRRVVKTAPDRIRTVVHQARAVALDDDPHTGTQTVRLSDGTRLEGLQAVVLAQGHLPVRNTGTQRERAAFAARHGLNYITPVNPADADLSAVRPGETVALLGLGLNFFDHMALFTLGRGGRFERRDGRLVYVASGLEPKLVAGSRRGMPFHSRGENQKGAHGRHMPAVLDPRTVEELRDRARQEGGLDFRRDLWPLIAKETETVYYTGLLAAEGRHAEAEALRTACLAAAPGSSRLHEILAEAGIGEELRWDWARLAKPYQGRSFDSPEEFRSWLLDHLRDDVAAARAGNVDGPLKAALDVLRDLRNEIRLIIDHGGLTGRSYRQDLDGWYTPLNAFLSIGPPASRIEEAIALIEADVLRVLGPEARLLPLADAEGAFGVESALVPGSRVAATTLIEARLPEIDLRTTADPLLRHLLDTGQCQPYEISGPGMETHETGGIDVTHAPFHLVDAGGRPHPRRFAYGVPTESVHWVTAAGIRPGVDSVTLQDSDAIAGAVLALTAGSEETRLPVKELVR